MGQLINKAISLFVFTRYEFSLKRISEQTIAHVFFKDMLIFKKKSNIDSLKVSYSMAVLFRLNRCK